MATGTRIQVQRVESGMFAANAYVVGCPTTHKGIIFDTGEDGYGIVPAAEDLGLLIERIGVTHAHVDHIGGLKNLKAVLDVPIAMHPDDAVLYEYAPQAAQMFGMRMETPPPVDESLHDGQIIRVGELEFTVIHCPGHSPGHVVFHTPGHVFCADVLFAGSIGRTDLPGGDYDTLIRSITERLFPLGDDTVCYPGHGPLTTIGRERATNPFLRG